MKRVLHALLLIAAYTFYVRIGQQVVDEWIGPGPAKGVGALIIFGLILGLGLFVAAKLRPRDVGWRFDHVGRDLALGVLGLVILSAGLLALLSVFRGVRPSDVIAGVVDTPWRQRVLFLGIGLGAALAEETLFRGYLQSELTETVGLSASVALTATVFAVCHLQFTALALAAKLFAGLVFGLLRGRDRSLVAPATAHVLYWVTFGWM
jgi:membrane protease YdiL (CAAX protease family)